MLFLTSLVAAAGLLLPHISAKPILGGSAPTLARRQFDNFADHDFKLTCAPEGKYTLDVKTMLRVKDSFKGFILLTTWHVYSDYNLQMAEDSGVFVTGRMTP